MASAASAIRWHRAFRWMDMCQRCYIQWFLLTLLCSRMMMMTTATTKIKTRAVALAIINHDENIRFRRLGHSIKKRAAVRKRMRKIHRKRNFNFLFQPSQPPTEPKKIITHFRFNRQMYAHCTPFRIAIIKMLVPSGKITNEWERAVGQILELFDLSRIHQCGGHGNVRTVASYTVPSRYEYACGRLVKFLLQC